MRTPDFEDRPHDYDWPQQIQALHYAARAMTGASDELEVVVAATEHATIGPAYALAGDAYKLLVAIRAEGERRLAAWEEVGRKSGGGMRGNEGE